MSQFVHDRQPPYSVEAEISVIGALLIDEGALTRINDLIGPESFFREANRRIFRAILRLHHKGRKVDPVTVVEDLKDAEELASAGGVEYLAELIDAVPSSANVQHHAAIVREKHQLRQLIDASSETIRDVYDRSADDNVDRILHRAEERVYRVSKGAEQGGRPYGVHEIAMDAVALIEQDSRATGGVTGLPTGFPWLDHVTAGLQPGELTILAGRPSMGKTSLAWQIAERASRQTAVGVISLETTKEMLLKRAIASRAQIDLMKIRRGELSEREEEEVARAANWISGLPIEIVDRLSSTVADIRAQVRRMDKNLGLIVLDYLQLMHSGDAQNRTQEVSQISRGLKELARDLGIHVLALSQLSRAVENRSPPKPQLSDLRDSGAIEQDADVVLMLWRPEYYFDEKTPNQARAEWQDRGQLILAKQRNGPTGQRKLVWHAPTMTFTELAKEQHHAGRAERVSVGSR